MSTWHQDQNPAALAALWRPHPVNWKCISDKVGEPASSMSFPDEASARQYALQTGDVLIAPKAAS